jgi:hypothetical protein
VRKFLVIICLLAASNSWAGIGTVVDAKGTACSIERGKTKLNGAKGAEVESMDTYVTGACVTNITFKDDTKVKVTENSRLLIDDFVFDPKKSDAGKLALKVGMGSVRYASGQIAKNNPQQVDIKTPTATIAVRGTDFNMTVDETGQSLVILLPSCKDDTEVKKYELEENKCRVGKIEVSTLAGTVTLDEAFAGTYVFSANILPTPPRVINIVESHIGNQLLLAQPKEVKQAIREATGRDQEEKKQQQQDLDMARDQSNNRYGQNMSAKDAELLKSSKEAGAICNPIATICVNWERTDTPDLQQRGRGVAFRTQPGDHYAEVKTQGYTSNTTVTITQNDNPSTEILGDGSPGGNVVTITQSLGIRRR